MPAHRDPAGADVSFHAFQDPVWSIAQPGRRWPLRVRMLARLQAPWLDLALASGADPSDSPQLERRAAHLLSHVHRVNVVAALRQSRRSAGTRIDPGDLRVPVDPEEVRIAERRLVELEDLLISPTPVYAHGVVMAAKIVGDGTGPLYAPSRRGELGDRVTKVIAALRGTF
ncbi:MAG TPA: hypothetical protein VHS74_05200 [Solirubrobacterales bacterium]|jgi:hypothetical protein|nr:hypothetical protein [Solirubrobacterales bacterium]